MARSLVLLGLLLATVMLHSAHASDPDLTADFNVTNPNAGDFTFTGFRNVQPAGPGMTTGTLANITGLSGLGLSAVLFEFGPQGQRDPHIHPRGTELLHVLAGEVGVGFVDTANELFEATLQAGDIFVFPKGTLHWQRNNGPGTAITYAVFSSENPGLLFIAEALFTSGNTGLPDIVLSTAFAINATNADAEIDHIKQAVAARNNVTSNY